MSFIWTISGELVRRTVAQLSLTLNQFTHKSGFLVKYLVLFGPEAQPLVVRGRLSVLGAVIQGVSRWLYSHSFLIITNPCHYPG